jgi:hypothetical protein
LIVPEGTRKSRPLSPDELDALGFHFAARAIRMR